MTAPVTEIWKIEMTSDLDTFLRDAARAEDEGWDGISVTDSQNRSLEAFVALAAAATRTSQLGLGIGVSNSLTRHPALMASAAASLQRLSDGRFTLTIGRGDSAAAHIGAGPARLNVFERYVAALRNYLRGEDVDINDAYSFLEHLAPPVSSLNLAEDPQESTLRWLEDSDVPVPLEVVGSGPKVLGVAAVYSDRPAIAVGANLDRIRWAIDTIREAREQAGLDTEVEVCAYVTVVPHSDPEVARRLMGAVLPSSSRFSVMQGQVNGPVDDETRDVLNKLRDGYSMKAHGTSGTNVSALMSDKFTQSNGIAGPSEYCVERLQQVFDQGVTKVVLFPSGRNVDPAEADQARVALARDVVPHFSRRMQKA